MTRARSLLTALAVLAVVTTSCGDGDTTSDGVPVASPQYQAFRAQPTACGAETPPPAVEMSFEAPEDLGLAGTPEAVLHTSCGEIRLELDTSLAPQTVNSFVYLAEQGYFDGTVIHRVASGAYIQAGDPTASGRGGPGYTIPDELPPAGFTYVAGTLAMANAGPGTAGSQFFIVIRDAPLPPDYSVFGRVTAGDDVIAEMEAVPKGEGSILGEQSRPLETIYLERVEILR
jgi:peptidyl-prolyl cis-trans isomerase B (cyclophilin B)